MLTADEQYIADETARDHERAKARGERVEQLTDSVLSHFIAVGVTVDRAAVRVGLFHVLADALYGNSAIDIPRGRT